MPKRFVGDANHRSPIADNASDMRYDLCHTSTIAKGGKMAVRTRTLVLPSIVMTAFLLAGCGPKPVTFNVELSDFKFTPSSYEADGGADVTLVLTNVASVEHEWVLFEKGYQVTLPFDDDDEGHIYWEGEVEAGETQTLTFVAPAEAGQYQVVCGVAGHTEAGMIGSFTVR
jgi:uncharacterized cupredoxin-like copper-binding protein